MPLVSFTNNLQTPLTISSPISLPLKARQTVTKRVASDALESSALVDLVKSGAVSAVILNDPDLPDNLEKAGVIQSRTVTITHANLTDDDNGDPQEIPVGAPLPTGAVVLGHAITGVVAFDGGGVSEILLDLGGTDPDAIVAGLDLIAPPTAADLAAAVGILPQGSYSGQQLTVTLTPDGGANLADLTVGAVTVTVWFAVLG